MYKNPVRKVKPSRIRVSLVIINKWRLLYEEITRNDYSEPGRIN